MTLALLKLSLCAFVHCTPQERAALRQEFRDARASFCRRNLIDDYPFDDDGSDE